MVIISLIATTDGKNIFIATRQIVIVPFIANIRIMPFIAMENKYGNYT
jgi:hypothetical protein